MTDLQAHSLIFFAGFVFGLIYLVFGSLLDYMRDRKIKARDWLCCECGQMVKGAPAELRYGKGAPFDERGYDELKKSAKSPCDTCEDKTVTV